MALDAVFAAALTVVTWPRVMDAYRVYDPHHRGYGKPSVAQLTTVLACVVAVGAAAALRRWRPLGSAVAVFGAWVVIVFVAGQLTIANLAGFQVMLLGLLVTYTAAAILRPPLGLGVLVLGLIGAELTELGSRELWNNLVLATLGLTTAWAVGYAVSRYRAYAAALREHQADTLKAELAEERIRLARELHDVIAHSMAVVNVQAGYGRFAPGKAEEALAAIQSVSRDALTEMRGLLTVLREGGVGGGEAVPLAPAPGLAEVDKLVATSAEAGVAVQLRVQGPARELSAGLELSAFRIVQEALTNVVKHAHTGAARVLIEYRADALVLEVVDGGRGRGDGGGGHGLVGMAERVGLYGGTLEAGPLPGGGWRVRALLPVAEAVDVADAELPGAGKPGVALPAAAKPEAAA